MRYLIICLYCFLWLVRAAGSDLPKQPNIVFILVDDLGWTDLASYSSGFYQTPNIDALAARGVKFTQAYSACTVCSPARASILTGKYPARLNCTDYIPGKHYPFAKLNVPDWTMYLDTAEVTIAEMLKANGYTTAHIGKWHLGDEVCYWPDNQGFDLNIGGWAKGAPMRHTKKGYNGYFSPFGNPRIKEGPEEEYLVERLAGEACHFIETHAAQPFFLNYWLYGVHLPLQAANEKIEKYEVLRNDSLAHRNAIYAAMVEHVDDAVGKLLGTLEDHNLMQNTIIILTSDNGGLIGNAKHHQQQITSNKPLRSGKGDMYEGGVRVPCIIVFENVVAPGISDEAICSPDFFPTIMDFAGIDVQNQDHIDGVSLKALLVEQQQLLSRELFWHYPHYHNEGAVPHSAVRCGNYKLIHNIESDTYSLFNLKQDIGETINLFESEPKIAWSLVDKLNAWKQKVKAQMPVENTDYKTEKSKLYERAVNTAATTP